MPNITIVEPNITLQSPFIMILNGMLAFLSPCILPMLPVYASYLLGTTTNSFKLDKAIIMRLLGLVLGFIIVFSALGAIGGLAGAVSSESKLLRTILDIISSILLILFGLMMFGIIPGLSLFSYSGDSSKLIKGGFIQNMIFGAVLVLSWAPCLTPTLGLALTAAASSNSANVIKGIYMLLFYAIGLSVPFVAIILLYTKLGGLLGFLKKHLNIIRKVAGAIMVIMGLISMVKLF